MCEGACAYVVRKGKICVHIARAHVQSYKEAAVIPAGGIHLHIL